MLTNPVSSHGCGMEVLTAGGLSQISQVFWTLLLRLCVYLLSLPPLVEAIVIFSCLIVLQWHKLPREIVAAPSLEVLKT